jgi:hypothetical protein
MDVDISRVDRQPVTPSTEPSQAAMNFGPREFGADGFAATAAAMYQAC